MNNHVSTIFKFQKSSVTIRVLSEGGVEAQFYWNSGKGYSTELFEATTHFHELEILHQLKPLFDKYNIRMLSESAISREIQSLLNTGALR